MLSQPPKSPSHSGRLFYIDVARVVAILGVIAIHNWSILDVLVVGTKQWWFADVLITIGRWAVPVFVMISGGLLLQPGVSTSPASFYRRRLARIGLPMVFWIIAYFVFRGAFLKQDLTLNGIAVDLFNATPFVHLYYLYVIAGLYLVAPIIGAFTAQASRFALVMAATAMLAVPVLESLLRFWLGTRSGGVTGLSYWVPYLGYFIAGRAFRGFRLSGRLQVTISLLIACVITFQIVSLYLLARASVPIGYPLGYFSVFTVGSSLLIYVLAAQDSPGQFRLGAISKVMASLSIATFGVYLAHEMLLRWYGRTVGSGAGNHLATALIPTYVVAVVGTFALVLLARRIPIVRSVF